MAKYRFKISDDGSTVGAALKVLAMIQDKEEYSATVDANTHILTITIKDEDAQWSTIKKTLRRSRWKSICQNIWKWFCDWWAQKSYWFIVLLEVPFLVVSCNGDIVQSIAVSAVIDVMIIMFLMSEQ